MKNNFYILALLFLSVSIHAQKNVVLNINHFIGDEFYDSELIGTNDLGNDFKVNRLEYYLSQITLIHDGGAETLIEDLWLLVNPELNQSYELGQFTFENLEGIRLGIGVEEEVNHDDPALWPSDHPLAPKNPSMHWGWAGGYRFVAMEGTAGSNFNTVFELHGTGDVNYSTTQITLEGVTQDDQVDIYVNADYAKALEGISLNDGIISHGEIGEAKLCLRNFRDYVFSPGSFVSSNNTISLIDFTVYPNPSLDGNINLETAEDALLELYDVHGKLVFSQNVKEGYNQFSLQEKGVYLAKLINQNSQATKRIVVK